MAFGFLGKIISGGGKLLGNALGLGQKEVKVTLTDRPQQPAAQPPAAAATPPWIWAVVAVVGLLGFGGLLLAFTARK